MSIHQLAAGKAIETVTPKQVFDDALPKAFNAMKQQARGIKATFFVRIFGKGGGKWFIDPRNQKVVSGKDKRADCVLEMGMDEFNKLTTGKLDAAAAMRAGTMRYTGDPNALIALGAFLGG